MLIKISFFQKILFTPKAFTIINFQRKNICKKILYDNTQFSVTNIPFNNAVIDFIKSNKKHYISTILISGSYYKYVEYIADYLKIFDHRVGTTLTNNMISMNKVKYIRNKFDITAFDYIGDSKKDIPIWNHTRIAYVVNKEKIKNKIKKSLTIALNITTNLNNYCDNMKRRSKYYG